MRSIGGTPPWYRKRFLHSKNISDYPSFRRVTAASELM